MVRRLLGSAALVSALTWLVHAQDTRTTNVTGALNVGETSLTTANVNVAEFGKLYTHAVDGDVRVQPVHVTGVSIDGALRDVLYVATTSGRLYAFDATGASAAPLWIRDFNVAPSAARVPAIETRAGGADAATVIEGTPVVDRTAGTIYLVARTKERGETVARLHALDVRTGQPRPGSPVAITGAVPGSAPDSAVGRSGPVVRFDPETHVQRTPLVLSNGVVLIAWGTPGERAGSRGWIMAYDAHALVRVGVFCASPDAYGGGILQRTYRPAVDATGHVYFATGPGEWDGTRHFANSLLKFRVSPAGMVLVDFFTPSNHTALNIDRQSTETGSFEFVPGTTLLLGSSTARTLYLLDSTKLGGLLRDDRQIVHTLQLQGGDVIGGPVFWNSTTGGPVVYYWPSEDVLKAYRLDGARLAPRPHVEGDVVSSSQPGGTLTLSSSGGTAGTAIVWASTAAGEAHPGRKHGAVLRAYDAETLREIWTSEQDARRDRVGALAEFVPPVVANGRVYVATGDGAVAVYGRLSPDDSGAAAQGAVAAAFVAAAVPGAIGINFTGSHTTAMGAAETAGLVAKPNWNSAVGVAPGTPVALVDEAGAPTGATVVWSASGAWMMPITDAAGNRRMMKGYLDTTSTSTTTVTVAGLAPAPYDVYIYADGDNRSYDRSAAYTISGAGITTNTINLTDPANTNFSTTFIRADNSSGNYVKFSINAAGFTLTASPTAPATGTRRAPVNGIQIVPTSVPVQDFTVSATPSSRTVTPGASTSYAVTVAAENGFSGTVALAVTGLPGGTTAGVTPASVTGSGTATVNVTTSPATPPGTSTLTITGTSGQMSRTARVTLVVGPPRAGAIGIDFLGSSTVPMAAAESAGVVPTTHWNNAAGAVRSTPLPLTDDTGALTTASVTWTANGGWMTPIADQPGNARLMKGYLDTSSTSATNVTVTGLVAATYDVYVYADGDNREYTRTGAYRISGADIITKTTDLTDLARTNFSGIFTEAAGTPGNYVKFRITATGFTLTATPTTATSATFRAPVNAIQIIRATEDTPPVVLDPPLTVTGIGAGQGIEVRDGKVYLYGDATTGVVREYDVVDNSSLRYTGRQVLLTVNGQDVVAHPTGLTIAPGLPTLLGNTVSERGTIRLIDWARALANGTLDGAVQATITDDLAINGTRPEYVRVGDRWLVATADYGNLGNEVRLYDPERLKIATRTSEPGVLVARFRSSAFVQTLHWIDSAGLLVLVQNQRSGAAWRLTVVDLARSIDAGQEVVTLKTDPAPQSELEGFHIIAPGRGLFLTSSSSANVYFANVRLY